MIEVEQVKPEAESKIDKTIAKWSARFVAVPAAALSFVAGLWSWVRDSPTNLTITLIITGCSIAEACTRNRSTRAVSAACAIAVTLSGRQIK